MPGVPDASDEQIVRALYVCSVNFALDKGSTPAVMRARLDAALSGAGLSFSADPSEADILATAAAARAILADETETDPDIRAMRARLELALAEVVDRPALFQEVATVAIGGSFVIALAVLGKIKLKDGRWELVEGLPGFERLASLFPKIFA